MTSFSLIAVPIRTGAPFFVTEPIMKLTAAYSPTLAFVQLNVIASRMTVSKALNFFIYKPPDLMPFFSSSKFI